MFIIIVVFIINAWRVLYIHIYIIWDLGLVKINFNHKWDYHHMGNLARWNVVYLDAQGQGIE